MICNLTQKTKTSERSELNLNIVKPLKRSF